MQRWGVALALILLSILVDGGCVNYCGARMCGNTNTHTFCQYSEDPSSDCVGYIPADLSLEEKARVISRLNQRRNEAAAGRLRGLPSAGNMLRLRWVEELAREAQRWANQCRPPQQPEEHDACRDLYSIPVGQCVASVVGEAPGLRVESMVDMWNLQALLYKGNVTYYVPPEENGRRYDDFAQIMWSRTYMVGCGRSRFMTMKNGRLRSVERLVCNFAPHGPVPGRPLWAPALPKTACPPRAVADEGFSALCNFHEDLHDDTFTEASMTLKEHLLLNTILEIENNVTLDYVGSLDEIFLTKLAITTLEHTVTSENHVNSIQRRDVVDISEMEDIFNDNKVNNEARDLVQETNVATSSTKESSSRKIGLVGRPKSYQMEELNDVENTVENKDAMIEEASKSVKNIYNEYDVFENEDNVTLEELIYSTSELSSLDGDGIKQTHLESSTTLEFNYTLKENGNTTVSSLHNNLNETSLLDEHSNKPVKEAVTQHYANISADVGDKLLEDYLSDPETVRQLQEALDRMESSMALQQSTEKSGKVRREIRNPDMESGNSDPERSENKESSRDIEKNPMMSMAFKYVPYLKQYEHQILGKNNANSMLSRSFLVFCLIHIV